MVDVRFRLGYRFDPLAAERTRLVDMASADAVSLRYHLFPGDVILEGEAADLSAPWGWVQILDFALGLEEIQARLAQEREAQFDFTESNAALQFRLDGDTVIISSTYAPGLLRVAASEFRQQVKQFKRRVVDDLRERHPSLALNPELR